MKIFLVLFSGISLFISACGGGGNYVPAQDLASIVKTLNLTVPEKSVGIGSKLKLTPIIVQADGNIPENPKLKWQISDEKIAKISPDGELTALSAGDVTVTCSFGGKETALQITVKTVGKDGGVNIASTDAELSKIKKIIIKKNSEVSPVVDYRIEKLDSSISFEALAYDENNNQLKEITFNWSSSDKSVALVNSTGVVTAVATGSTNITASAGDKISNIVRVIIPSGSVNVNVDFQGD